MAHWYTVEEAQNEWADWPREEDDGTDLLSSILAAAKAAVLAYAPVLTDTAPEPVTMTDGPWTLNLSAAGSLVTATLSASGVGVGTFIVPESFVPVGRPSLVVGADSAYFSGNTVLDAVASGAVDLDMWWEATTPSANPVIPDGWRMAQLLQARNIWNSGKATPTGDFDGGQYSLTTFPLDWQVRQLIRPKRGRPVMV